MLLNRPGGRLILILAASSLLVAGCQTHSIAGKSGRDRADGVVPASEIAALDEASSALAGGLERDAEADSRIEAHAHYATALIHEMNGEAEAALTEFNEAAMRDLDNESLVLEVSRGLIQGKQLESALELLTRATARPNASGKLFARLGFVYFQLGKEELAINANRTAVKREPRSLVGYQNLFLIQLQNKKPQEALAVLDQAGKVSQPSAEFLVGLGELYANLGLQNTDQRTNAFARGLTVLQRAAKGKPTDPQLRLRLADAFNMLGREDEASLIYEALLPQVSELPQVREVIRAKLTDIYLRSHDHRRATEQLQGVIRENPTDSHAYYFLGSIAYSDTNFTQAVECFSKVVLLQPDFEQAYYDLAGAQISNDQPAEALGTLLKAREKFPQKFYGEYLMGLAYQHQKDFTNALNHYTAAEIIAQATDPKQLRDSFYFQLGTAAEQQKDYAQAEKYFEKCLELSPNFTEAQNYLAYMWAERGEKLDRARELIAKALKAEPQNAAYLDTMGWVLLKLNQPQEALEYLLEAVKNSEEPDATVFDHLGDVYAVLQQMDKAAEAWRKSLAVEDNQVVRNKLLPVSAHSQHP